MELYLSPRPVESLPNPLFRDAMKRSGDSAYIFHYVRLYIDPSALYIIVTVFWEQATWERRYNGMKWTGQERYALGLNPELL
jgi:hypothetical protein